MQEQEAGDKFLLIHQCIRNDSDPCKKFRVYTKLTFDEAFEKAYKKVKVLAWQYEFKERHKKIIRNKVERGYGMWVWEWRKKGNGDFFRIIKIDPETNKYTFVPCTWCCLEDDILDIGGLPVEGDDEENAQTEYDSCLDDEMIE